MLQSADQALEDSEGWVKYLAVWQRSTACAWERRCCAGFACYAGKDRKDAALGVDMSNPTAPLSLYESVGLRETPWIDMYELSVPAAGV